MVPFLTFLKDTEYVIYFVLFVISIRFLYRIVELQLTLQKTLFGLEKTLLQRKRNGALGVYLLLALAAGTVYLSGRYLLPEAVRAEQQQVAGDAIEPTAIPTPTPYILFGVDVSGCMNSRANISSPRPGDTVQGPVDIRMTANAAQFAFYRIELGSPDSGDIWMTLYTGNEPITEEVAFTWDSSTMPPGVYHLRLTVVLRDGNSPRPCLIPIQILSPPPQ